MEHWSHIQSCKFIFVQEEFQICQEAVKIFLFIHCNPYDLNKMSSEMCSAEEPLMSTWSSLGLCCGACLLAIVLNDKIHSPGVVREECLPSAQGKERNVNPRHYTSGWSETLRMWEGFHPTLSLEEA